MLQCGKQTIKYTDTTIVYDLPAGRIMEKLSAQIHSCDIPTALFAKLEKDPHEYVARAIGADELEEKKQIRVARKIQVTIDNATVDRLDCVIFPKHGQRDAVLYRSGSCAVQTNYMGRDPNNKVVTLAKGTTLQQLPEQGTRHRKSLGSRAHPQRVCHKMHTSQPFNSGATSVPYTCGNAW